MKKTVIWFFLLSLLLSGCKQAQQTPAAASPSADDRSFGESLEALGVYEGYFEGDSQDITVTTQSGTKDPYTLSGGTLTFTAIDQDTVCTVSGTFRGSIVIDVGDEYKFDLELTGLSLVCDSVNPITVKSGSEVSLTAKKDTQNYIYDMRAAVEDEALYSAAVYSLVDLELKGKGALTVCSENNNGIHTKDDLQVKNLTLLVACVDNALKGNDSVALENGTTTLIASGGDGIKTTNTAISDKGNQRGTVTVTGGTHTVYAACDGIDAAYDAVIDGDTTALTVYTHQYSNYSQVLAAVSDAEATSPEQLPSRLPGDAMSQPFDSAEMPQPFDGAEMPQSFDSAEIPQRPEGMGGMEFPEGMGGRGGMGGMERPDGTGGHWGMGGMDGGNPQDITGSAKGIKAGNQIRILNGSLTVKAYDDALHASCDSTLENGAAPLGNVTVSGGTVSLYSNDDGIHADGIASVTGGTVTVSHSYEGLEGSTVSVTGGSVSLAASDDGINATATSGQAITLSGGRVYVYAGGDGIDANSRSAYEGIVFAGADVVIISTGGGNSSIDTEQGYRYEGGRVLALMPSGGMVNEATHCENYTGIATGASMTLSQGEYLTVAVNGENILAVQMPTGLSGLAIYLGSSDATLFTASEPFAEADQNGVTW